MRSVGIGIGDILFENVGMGQMLCVGFFLHGALVWAKKASGPVV